LDGYSKKKYVCKLLFIFLLGHDIDFGHMEAVNLLSSNKYTEKQIVSLERRGSGPGSLGGGLGPGPLGLREEDWVWTPGSEGGGLGPGPLGLREEGWAWTLGSEGGGLGLDPWV
jgi:hypothetical protein